MLSDQVVSHLLATDGTAAGFSMTSIPFFQTVLSLMFIGIWVLVGQIVATERL